jgi:hypothetical protein
MDFKDFNAAGCWDLKTQTEMFGSKAKALEFTGFDGSSRLQRKYEPDDSKGYVLFSLAHAFPVLCERGCLHAGTVGNSWGSMVHQGLNYDHRVKAYYGTGTNIEDRYIGSILAADFPSTPPGGWRLTDYNSSPGMTCVANVFKSATGLGKIIGEYQTGRHEWTVSMEVSHQIEEAGVVIYGNEEDFKALSDGENSLLEEGTPGDFKAAGYGYVALNDVADDFRAFWNPELMRFDKKWKGRSLHLMYGGLNGRVHFKGTGVVKYGAEPTAKLEQVLASASGGNVDWKEENEAAVREVLAAIGNFEIG